LLYRIASLTDYPKAVVEIGGHGIPLW